MKCLSLFANVGIGETYFGDLGIEVAVANEFLEDRAEFYRLMHPATEMICGDITDLSVFDKVIDSSKRAGVELIVATPPCQGMSNANAKRADKNDPRNSLIKQVIRATKELSPKYVLVENVPGMASEKTFILDEEGEQVNILPYIKSQLGTDYEVVYEVLDAAEHSTPHHRKRLITLLSRRDCPLWTHPNPSTSRTTVREVIGGFCSLESGQDSPVKWHSMRHKRHNKHHIKWMQHTPTGKTAFENKIYFSKK